VRSFVMAGWIGFGSIYSAPATVRCPPASRQSILRLPDKPAQGALTDRAFSWKRKRVGHLPAITPRRRLDILFAVVVGLLLIWQLFIPPALSVADNNDFQKLAGNDCLGPASGKTPELFDYTSLHWYFSPSACTHWPFRTVAQGALILSMGLNRLFTSNSNSVFDLRWIGVVYAILFLAGFVYLQRALSRAPLVASVCIQTAYVLAVCNAVYVPLLNTFYFDVPALAGITGALAGISLIVLGREVPARRMLITALWLGFIAGSKPQHAPLALFLTPVFWLRLGRISFAPLWARAVSTAIVIAAALIPLTTAPSSYGAAAAFDAFFYRILPGASHPDRYLAETRIPASWIRYSGQHAFAPGGPLEDPATLSSFTTWFGPSDLISLYIRHPEAAWKIASINLDEASRDRVRMMTGQVEHRLGNYERSTGKPPQALSQFFCVLPVIKYAFVAGRPRTYLAYILVVIGLLWILAPPVERIKPLLGFVTGSLALAFLVSMLDGVEGGRHLIIFNFILDLVLCADIGLAAQRFWESARPVPPRVASNLPLVLSGHQGIRRPGSDPR
jgi:hypothetical protein